MDHAMRAMEAAQSHAADAEPSATPIACDRIYAEEATQRIRLGGSACRCGLWYLGEHVSANTSPASTPSSESTSTRHKRAA